ncbi:YonK family protein [Paenibacillus sp. FSL E2-0178]|uniref:YonK family protein n=1 Tax=Paenibacillus sp. FSL E2-0178 TaxID=2921361 RepID=UPI0031596562
MAKRNNSIQFKGLLNTEVMEITEEDKNGIATYDLLDELKFYDGKHISISIKEDLPVQPKE